MELVIKCADISNVRPRPLRKWGGRACRAAPRRAEPARLWGGRS